MIDDTLLEDDNLDIPVPVEEMSPEDGVFEDFDDGESESTTLTEVELLQAELAEWKDRALRSQADFENFRKRTNAERATLVAHARADTVAKLLPVYDNLLRATAHQTADEAFAKGVTMTLEQLLAIFADLGVEFYGAVGDVFDPNTCEAVATEEVADVESGTITTVFAQGVRLGDRILRYAMVKVAS